ncbi:helix-turn-helix domain-containing protein [Streptomyces sp. NPDC088810]|uniref:helix-turn-helix domain-containing protein n=1 Tax=Streptomyces sp. NPDC088810 TaxID=3365904 RepID=UPI0038223985
MHTGTDAGRAAEKESTSGERAGQETSPAQLADVLRQRLDQLSDNATAAVLEQLPSFRDRGPHWADLTATVRQFLHAGIDAVAQSRTSTTASEVEFARAYGARRALQGIPSEELTLSFYVALRAIWISVPWATTQGDDVLGALVGAMERSMLWLQNVVALVSAGHQEALAGTWLDGALAGQQLLTALDDTSTPEADVRAVLERLGMDPEGTFQAWVAPCPDDGTAARLLRAHLAQQPGRCAVVHTGDHLVLVGQDTQASTVETALAQAGAASVGVGLPRAEVAGARRSLADARAALRTARRRAGVHRYADVWLVTLAEEPSTGTQPLFEDALATARAHPHLADAVRAFADHGFSVAAAARALHLHPNTLTYRLDRWCDLTGLDCRDYMGLVTSRTAVALL